MKIMDSGANNILANKLYVDYIAKQLEELIITHINESNAHKALYKQRCGDNIDTKSYDLSSIEIDGTIKAKDVEEDSTHKFISEYTLDIINSFPSIEEFVHRAEILDEKVIESINTKIDKIINSPYSLNKLKTVAAFLREEPNMEKIVEILSSKLDADDFIDHLSMEGHLTSLDRHNLKTLNDIIRNGGIDWESDIILNKPSTYKAKGGDCDTINGKTIDDISNRQFEDLIIGYDKSNYRPNNGIMDIEEFSKYPNISIRSGKYSMDKLLLKNNTLIGSGKDNCILRVNLSNIYSSSIRDIKFFSSNIRIYDSVELTNCHFSNCSITLVQTQCSIIKNCLFDHSDIKYEGLITNNIIKDNIFDDQFVKYLGGNNIISDNLIKKNK